MQRAVQRARRRSAGRRRDEHRHEVAAGPATTASVLLHLQATAGNRAVSGLLGVQRAGGSKLPGAPDLSAGEEEQLLQRDALPIQRAWTGRRQLSGLGWLGKPWVVRRSDNIVNLRVYHEHIFFEDGGAPPDIGHMGSSGLGQDSSRIGDYSRVQEDLDDAKMRRAVRLRGNPGSYGLLTNNCQDYVQSVLRIYRRL